MSHWVALFFLPVKKSFEIIFSCSFDGFFFKNRKCVIFFVFCFNFSCYNVRFIVSLRRVHASGRVFFTGGSCHKSAPKSCGLSDLASLATLASLVILASLDCLVRLARLSCLASLTSLACPASPVSLRDEAGLRHDLVSHHADLADLADLAGLADYTILYTIHTGQTSQII